MKKTVSLWFDGGGRYGFGNVRRSLELGSRLCELGHDVSFCPLSEEAARLAKTAKPLQAKRADIVVLDLPYAGDYWLQRAQADGARVLALDYEGEGEPELVVSLQAVRGLPPSARHLVGIEYAVVRSEFKRVKKAGDVSGPVLVLLGGGASAENSARIVRRVARLAKSVVLVQGPLAETLADLPGNVRVVITPENLAELMASCAWAVTTGGTSLLEFLYLARPVYALPRTAEEAVFSATIAARGALLGVGEETLQTPTLESCIKCMTIGSALVDGAGCERIGNLITTLT